MNGAKRDSRTQLPPPSLPVWARWDANGLTLALHAQPGARRTAIAGEHGQRLKIALHAPPVDGKANNELLRFLATELRLRRTDLRLASGQASREKTVLIDADAPTAGRIVVQLAGQAENPPAP